MVIMSEEGQNQAVAAVLSPVLAGVDPEYPRDRGTGQVESAACYRNAAANCVPRWLHVVGTAPWLKLVGADAQRMETGALLRYMSAATALGLYADVDRGFAAGLREHVRAAFVIWQSQLRADGSPRSARERHHPLHACIASRLAQWLCESGDSSSGMLLDDLDRHIQWLQSRVYRASWLEAANVTALADAAVVLRKSDLLRAAHHRVSRLLARQTKEGWFPEHGGVDFGLHTLTIDALARVYHQHGWEELSRPLDRALLFLRHFVTPTGAIGGCCSTVGTGFISPYGVELLAPTHDHAAALAAVVRRRFKSKAPTGGWSDDLAALLGPALLLAAKYGRGNLSNDGIEPVPERFITRFDQAKLVVAHTRDYRAVVSMRQGGACWTWWSGQETLIEDPGVCAVFPSHTRSSGRADPRNKYELRGAAVACGGVLRRISKRRPRLRFSLQRWLRRLIRPRRKGMDTGSPLAAAAPLSKDQWLALAHDHFRREISFHEDRIEFTDEVICRMACQNVICASAVTTETNPLIDTAPGEQPPRPPHYLRGGRHVVVTRVYQDGRLKACRDRLID